MDKLSGEITMRGNPITLLGTHRYTDEIAPDFTVIDQDLSTVKLSDFNRKTKIINIVPSIDTSVCDMQIRQFNQRAAEIENVIILSISVDLPFALKRYCAAEGIDSVKTLSDHKELDFGLKYGFVIEELRLLSRGLIVLDKSNLIKYIEYVKEVSDLPDFETAIEVAKNCF